MSILVIAEQAQGEIKAATLSALQAAVELKAQGAGDISLLVSGAQAAVAAEQASAFAGVDKVLLAGDASLEHQLAENVAPAVHSMTDQGQYSHILAAATNQGKNVLPRLAALLDVAQVSEIIEVVSADTFVRPIYAGNALAKVRSTDSVKVITVRAAAFDPVATQGGSAAIENLDIAQDSGLSSFAGEELSVSERPELGTARTIISGGRGMQSGDNFVLLEKVADKLGAAVGASRAAVDAGFVPNDMQVGQTGKIVAPDLYVAVGISGAIQHLAGMKDSKVIVAINKDEEAPIFGVSDYGLVADLFEALPQLEQEL
ncbi:MAG: electron transfer flavoprotein subunit alpha/FixB family protein [Pseudomonadales bacterium]